MMEWAGSGICCQYLGIYQEPSCSRPSPHKYACITYHVKFEMDCCRHPNFAKLHCHNFDKQSNTKVHCCLISEVDAGGFC